jgi:hypothetical protein
MPVAARLKRTLARGLRRDRDLDAEQLAVVYAECAADYAVNTQNALARLAVAVQQTNRRRRARPLTP